jgi:hypothetical protein
MDSEKFSQELLKMFYENPVQLTEFMAIAAGKMCIEANTEKMDVIIQAEYEGTQYEIKVKISLKKVKK